MRIFLVTDAWSPQVNGVVRTMQRVVTECEAMGHTFEIVSPADGFFTIPLPTYSEIKLAIGAKSQIEDRFEAFEPEAVHIATEGTLGMAARAVCLKHNFPFTTSYHTRFPEYVSARFPIPVSWGYAFVRNFHKFSGRVMVATASMREELEAQGFNNVARWSRGVDTELFHPDKRGIDGGLFKDLPRPIMLNVGRVAVEKNLEAFLGLDMPGTKVIVGDGPQLEELKAKYPKAVFAGAKFGDELARYFADADVFVFPSLTDTFGLVILEAMAAGTPVSGFVAPGPKDIIPGSNAGAVSDDLAEATRIALTMRREDCRAYAEGYSWRACAEEFVRNLDPLPVPERKSTWQRIKSIPRWGRRVLNRRKQD